MVNVMGVMESPVRLQREIHDYRGNVSHGIRAGSYAVWELNMLPAHPKGWGKESNITMCTDLSQRVLLPEGPACSLTSQRNPHPGSAWDGNRI